MDDSLSSIDLFGGILDWKSQDWTASDDRVRGGKSQSYLEIADDKRSARFLGNLDIEALGGAGFASQRTTGDNQHWNLETFDGIELTFDPTSNETKTYTLILKDQLLPPDPNTGREQSTISWEYDFSGKDGEHAGVISQPLRRVTVTWSMLKPTYRGRPKEDTEPLKLDDIKRFSIMMRSFFGTQYGDFSLQLISIRSVKTRDSMQEASHAVDDSASIRSSTETDPKAGNPNGRERKQNLCLAICCWRYKL